MAKSVSDKILREAVEDFFRRVDLDACRDADEASAAFRQALQTGFRIVEGIVFRTPQATRRAERKVARRVAELFGAAASDEKDVAGLLWQVMGKHVTSGDELLVSKLRVSFEAALQTSLAQQFQFIDSCQVVVLEPMVREIVVGPVAVRWTEDVGAELAKEGSSLWRISPADPKGMQISPDGTVGFNFWPNCWVVKLNASRKNVPNEAAWLINIAASFLRLSHEASTVFYPKFGDLEADPIQPTPVHRSGVVIDGTQISDVGSRVPGHYKIDSDLAAQFKSEAFLARANEVFARSKGTLAERVAQGLGWLARGRQSEDRAERLLYFFTALEALLSSDDNKAPVVQTIARHAAVILADAPDVRANAAKQVRDLYGVRSALVHRGSRNVTRTDADTTQMLVETLYRRVLEEADLKQTFDQFFAVLSHSTYGGIWPPPSPD